MSPIDGDSNLIGVHYCSGYVDKNNKWHSGFYCPPNSQDKDVFCCGSTSYKFCCSTKQNNQNGMFSNGKYISSATLFTVITATFIFAVMVTIVIFICCKKFWRTQKREIEIEETNSYRMPVSPTDFFWHDQLYNLSPSQLQPNSLTTCNNFINQPFPFSKYFLFPSYLDPNLVSPLEPPPPYHLVNPSSSNNRFLSYLSPSYRRDLVHPIENQKGIWHTFSQ